MPRLNESTQHSRMAPSIACGGGNATSGTPFSPVSTVVMLGITTAGTVSFHLLDGSTIQLTFPVGFFQVDIQCDTVTLGTAAGQIAALANPL